MKSKIHGIKKTAGWSKRESQYKSGGHLQICYNMKTGLVWPVWHVLRHPWPEYVTEDILFCGFLEKPATMKEITRMVLVALMKRKVQMLKDPLMSR